MEPKPIASLSSSLLARKGQAKPAMRPQGFASFGFGGLNGHDDLGWNDMGTDAPAPHYPQQTADIVSLVPPSQPAEAAPTELETAYEPPAVVRQQEELVREMTPAPIAEPVRVLVMPVVEAVQAAVLPRAAAGSKSKAAFTLRLEPDRHLRLRLACAVTHRSAQSLVIEALDKYLMNHAAVAEMARAATNSDR